LLNFPIPYHEELIYSTVARAGVHMGITSPKQLLAEVFNNRHVIATVDLPNHLERIAYWYVDGLGYNAERIAYEHTLFSVYAPFTIEARRLQCLKWMTVESLGAVHLTLGVAASRIKKVKSLNYCPVCMEQQFAENGEYFWLRQWQVSGANCCLQHGQLLETNLASHHNHRHQFFPATPEFCPKATQFEGNSQSQQVARQVNILLAMAPATSANFTQWSQFYSQLARQAGLKLGHNVQHEEIKERVLGRWPALWLNQHGLMVSDNQICWLRTIFRKHRKSFSYLEHIVVLASFLPEDWRIDEVLIEVMAMPANNMTVKVLKSSPCDVSVSIQMVYRKTWLELVKEHSAKLARKNGGGIYAWLYRHDRDWLIATNKQFQLSLARNGQHLDWHTRDLNVTRQLINIRKNHHLALDAPRGSRNWYLSKIGQISSIEKNLNKLPVTSLFFKKHCESVTDYQIRRIVLATIVLKEQATPPHRWRILRKAGLSKERITDLAKIYLNTLEASECAI
jgi:hypothetical protein